MIRLLYVCAFAALAALGEAAIARPAALWVRSRGLLDTVLAGDVPFGGLLLGAGALLASISFWIASRIALRRSPGSPLHVAFLLAAGICFALRQASGDPRPPPDPAPALVVALRTAAGALDAGYAGRYSPDAAELASSLAQVPSSPFRRLGRPVPLHARILSGADGPQVEALEGDQPGTLYVAISRDRQSAWLTVRSLDGMARLASGNPAVVEARGGTHALPGGDPATPAYPGARLAK